MTTTVQDAPPAGAGLDVRDAARRKHPWRWLSAFVVLVFAAQLAKMLVTNENFGWDVVWSWLRAESIVRGLGITLMLTVVAMLIGVVLGVLLAVCRISANPLLRGAAGLYIWFFRGTPTLVQLVFWFNLSSVFPRILGIDTNQLMTPFLAALLGLGLNFSAYYSEIVRAGILSVDEGQTDAAAAYGLSRFQTLARIILPQAMRVIVPPTGNEVIGMLKWTSLATVVSYGELLNSVQTIYNVNYEIIPLLMVAALWYLALTTVLSTGQFFLERYVARGSQRNPPQNWITANGMKAWRKVRPT